SKENLHYFEVLFEGSLLDVFQSNATYGLLTKIDFQLGFSSRFFLTIAYFIVGLCLGKMGLFERFGEQKVRIRKIMLACVGGIFVAALLTAGMFMLSGGNPMEEGFNWWSIFGMTGMDLVNICLTAVILCGYLLLYTKISWQKAMDRLAPYGRMALTNYVFQSIIGTFLFFGWGLGLLGQLSNVINLGLAIVIIFLQVVWSDWWLRRFYYGPLEWLWRSGTYWKWQPLKR
ncbi:MAG: DUF418 domain-containing protein, partial [Bacteroidota bacterium]